MRALLAAVSLILLCLASPTCCWADSVFTELEVIHGRVTSLDENGLVVQAGCNSSDTRKFTWTEAQEVLFDNKCDAAPTRLPSAGGSVCATAPVQVLMIYFRGASRPVYAASARLTSGGTLNYATYKDNMAGHGPISEVRGIVSRAVCPSDISDASPPATYCVEHRQWAVNFSYDAPLNNKILTKGFSFFLEIVPPNSGDGLPPISELRKLVQDGFATAIGSWTSELWRRRAHYDEKLGEFLDTRVSRSKTDIVLFTPPQVISLDCPQSATFVVRIFTQEIGPFAPDEPLKVAYAQLPGRTILLNFAHYRCWEHQYFRFVINPQTGCINIDPIFIHELGHAFGLGHSVDINSIMNSVIHVTQPLDADLDLTATQIMRSVQGDKPGVFEFTTDNGVAVE